MRSKYAKVSWKKFLCNTPAHTKCVSIGRIGTLESWKIATRERVLTHGVHCDPMCILSHKEGPGGDPQ